MAEPDGPRLLGIDIGGTRSRARLCTGGQITAESDGPSASLPAAGRPAPRPHWPRCSTA